MCFECLIKQLLQIFSSTIVCQKKAINNAFKKDKRAVKKFIKDNSIVHRNYKNQELTQLSTTNHHIYPAVDQMNAAWR